MDYLHAVGQKDEIKSMAVGGGQRASVDLLLKQLLDSIVLHRPARIRRSQDGRADA